MTSITTLVLTGFVVSWVIPLFGKEKIRRTQIIKVRFDNTPLCAKVFEIGELLGSTSFE